MAKSNSDGFLPKAVVPVTKALRGANVCVVCGLGIVCTTAVFIALIHAEFIKKSDEIHWLAIIGAWIVAILVCAWMCKGDRVGAETASPSTRAPAQGTRAAMRTVPLRAKVNAKARKKKV